MDFGMVVSPLVVTLAIVAVVGVLHSSFQLGVSVLTGLHAYGLGAEKRRRNLYGLCASYVIGIAFITLMMTLAAVYIMSVLAATEGSFWWAVTCGLGAGIGVAVLGFYFRSGKGTMLWLPRSASTYLQDRIKKTRTRYEAMTLGMTTVLAELPFIVAPVVIIAMLLRGAPSFGVIGLVGLYVLIAVIPLLVILGLVGSGHNLSSIQNWREQNKRFLQFAAGLGLIVVSLYLFSMYGIGPGA